jgi:hypothetical protein
MVITVNTRGGLGCDVDREAATFLAGPRDDMVIEDLDHASPVTVSFTYCG